jgi:hypothetical protein
MTIHTTDHPDPAWQPLIASRKVVLWIGASVSRVLEIDSSKAASVLARSWHSVYFDDLHPKPMLLETASQLTSLNPLTLRVVKTDPDDVHLASNRIPLYLVPPNQIENPQQLLIRLKMFARIPNASTVIALTINPASDMPSLQQALQVTQAVREVVIVSEVLPEGEYAATRCVHWNASLDKLDHLVANVGAPIDVIRREASILIESQDGKRVVDLSRAIDHSYPILDRFALIPADDMLREIQPTENLVRDLLVSPTGSWAPYSAGIPFRRHDSILADLRRILRRLTDRGAEASCTCWIDAEQASGITTLLRMMLFDLARDGLPILIAKPNCSKFDFHQIATFLRTTSEPLEKIRGTRGQLVWIIAFDAEHTARHDDFIIGLANGLRKLNHAVAVVAVRPRSPVAGDVAVEAIGNNHTLGSPLANVLELDEAIRFGEHINQFLPPHQHRHRIEWTEFANESERLTGEGKQSLFWLALRFWLLRLPGSDVPLRQWLSVTLRDCICDSDDRLLAVLYVASLSRHRLALPARLLTVKERAALDDPSNEFLRALGLRELWMHQHGSYAFAHPLIAEEIERICAGDAVMLSKIHISRCAGLLDFELSVLERLLKRESAGLPEVVPVIEDLAVSALRVDPREAPQNYAARDRIVLLLESVPDSVFDGSPVFLHHLAKARRHVAADPPYTDYWAAPSTIREQLELAESHLLEALNAVVPAEEDRQEKPLNLNVSLALTYDVRSRFEHEQGDLDASVHFAEEAQRAYGKAQAYDPDNTYVLENYARFKLRKAREEHEPTNKLELIVDAVSLLQWELAVDDSKRREAAVYDTLAHAFVMLDENVGITRLESLCQTGSEAAAVALARVLAMPDRFEGVTKLDPNPKRAIELLQSVPSDNVTWRSRFLLYLLVSRESPFAFDERLAVLDELDAIAEFPWPLQTKLEHGVLLYQMGAESRTRGQKVFQQVRDTMSDRSSVLTVPHEMRFLADVRHGFQKPLKTSLRVTRTSEIGRNYWGIPEQWGNLEIPFRPYRFPQGRIRKRDDLDCLIQFTSFGPQAVPPTEAE